MVNLTPPLQKHTCAHERKQITWKCSVISINTELTVLWTNYVAQLVAAVQGMQGDLRPDLMETVRQVNGECLLKGMFEQIVYTQD